MYLSVILMNSLTICYPLLLVGFILGYAVRYSYNWIKQSAVIYISQNCISFPFPNLIRFFLLFLFSFIRWIHPWPRIGLFFVGYGIWLSVQLSHFYSILSKINFIAGTIFFKLHSMTILKIYFTFSLCLLFSSVWYILDRGLDFPLWAMVFDCPCNSRIFILFRNIAIPMPIFYSLVFILWQKPP